MEGTSNILEGSSRRSRSGSQKRALAKASRILQPPEKVFVGNRCLSGENPKPARIVAARGSALSDSISLSLLWISLRVASRPSRSLSSLRASLEVSAMELRWVSISASWRDIFCNNSQLADMSFRLAYVPLAPPIDVSSRHRRPRLPEVLGCHLR